MQLHSVSVRSFSYTGLHYSWQRNTKTVLIRIPWQKQDKSHKYMSSVWLYNYKPKVTILTSLDFSTCAETLACEDGSNRNHLSECLTWETHTHTTSMPGGQCESNDHFLARFLNCYHVDNAMQYLHPISPLCTKTFAGGDRVFFTGEDFTRGNFISK